MILIIRLLLISFLLGLCIPGRTQNKVKVMEDEQNSERKMTSREIKLLVDSLSNALNKLYIYPQKSALMSARIKNELKKGTYSGAKYRSELAMQLSKDLQNTYPDPHMSVTYDPQMAERLRMVKSEEGKKIDRERDLNMAREGNFAFREAKVLRGNLGYVRWDMFAAFVDEAQPTLNSAFQFVSNCKALIIDMRYNGGGSPDMVLQIQNYFFDKKTHMNDIIFYGSDTLKRYTDPAKTNFKLNMPVYILTSHRTFSGAEDFTFGMQNNKRATVVGDTTGGGAHPTMSHDLGQGFVVFIPFGRAVEGKDWEGTGVIPDQIVPSEQALSKAQASIFSAFLSNAKNEKEKNMFQWQMNRINSETAKISDPANLVLYKGVYEGGLDFHISEGHLFCRNSENGNLLTELKYIDTNLFMLDDNVQVEFEKDASGSFSKIKMRWANGMITEKSKI